MQSPPFTPNPFPNVTYPSQDLYYQVQRQTLPPPLVNQLVQPPPCFPPRPNTFTQP